MTEETRSQKVFAMFEPSVVARLDAFARRRRWSRSSAVAYLVERGLDQDQEQDQEADAR